MFIAALAVACGGCDKIAKALETGGATPSTGTEALSEVYSTQNGLLSMHYPANFAAKSVSPQVVVISHILGGGLDEAITFAAIEKPISDDPKEFARVFDGAANGKYPHFSEQRRTETEYRGGHGFETVGTWSASVGNGYRLHAWTFVRGGHGYHFSYSVPDRMAATEEPLARRIIAAAEFAATP